jgi:hypothetical protein
MAAKIFEMFQVQIDLQPYSILRSIPFAIFEWRSSRSQKVPSRKFQPVKESLTCEARAGHLRIDSDKNLNL